MGRTFVLIHGSWHGGWAWDSVISELSEKGHWAHAPTLAGHGPGAARLGINHKACVDSVVHYIDTRALNDIILVGHSFGGTVVQRLAQLLADRIAPIVFLDALVLAEGQCVFDNLPPDYVTAFNALTTASSDNTMLLPGKSGGAISCRTRQSQWPGRPGSDYAPSPIRSTWIS
jgi:pimeloyl-ACP methyl ester carboxylesterase